MQVCFSLAWLPLVQGALAQLQLQTTWLGDPDDVLLAQGRATNLRGLFANPVCSVPAPYWDDSDGDDADDEAPSDDQDWYGVWDGETFVESLAYWAVTAFLATGISEGAAIEFITPLRTFRLQLKANPHGAKLLVFMDSNIVQLVDLFSATDEVIEVDVISPGSTLMLVHTGEHNPSATPDANGNYTVGIIRKELTENEVIPSNQRYNEDCDCVQFSPDNGTTWIDMPSLDPRHSDAFRYPLLDTSDPRCDAAANMVKWIKDFIDATTEALGEAALAFQVANVALRFFTLITGGSAVLLQLIVGAAETLTGIGYAALLAAFDSGQYDLMLCAFYCNIEGDGSVTVSDLEDIETQVTADLNTTAALVTNLILQLQGEVGVSNAGTIGGETGDCSECDCGWCVEWHLTSDTDPHGLTLYRGVFSTPDPGFNGVFVDSLNVNSFYIYADGLGSITVREAVMVYSVTNWSGANNTLGFELYEGATPVVDDSTPMTSIGEHLTKTWTGEATGDQVIFQGNVGDAAGQHIVLEYLRLQGVGDPPSIGVVCP